MAAECKWSDELRPITAIVVGDLMLDRYVFGEASRISPEAPVMILEAKETEDRAGGGAAVALFLSKLGSQAKLAGVIGCDEPGEALHNLLSAAGVDCCSVVSISNRQTTMKERFLGSQEQRRPHQMLRVDHETRTHVSESVADEILQKVDTICRSADVILVTDYAKGVCTDYLVQRLIEMGIRHRIPVLVDPGRGVPLSRYCGAWLLKPNRTEASEMIGQSITSVEQAMAAATRIMEQSDIEHLVITLDGDGSVFTTRDAPPRHLATNARQVADITGAGDMFLAALGLAVGNRMKLDKAIMVANSAAGIEVERTGSVAISLNELHRTLVRHEPDDLGKVISREALAAIKADCRRNSQKIVFTNGCFDLLHTGHIDCLSEARRLGDVLVVGINSDRSVARLKGSNRPVVPLRDRIRMLTALTCVSFVVVFEEDTPCALLRLLQPDVLAKGGTYGPDEVIGREIVEQYGGRIAMLSVTEGISTSKLISRIQDRELIDVATNNH